MANMVVKTLCSVRNEDCFDQFWINVQKKADVFDLEPQLPRQWERPRRYEDGEADPVFRDHPKDFFSQLCYEAFDLVVNCIQE